MAIVASGTLITFGTAGAEEVPQARPGAQIPAASEANPVVEGQPLPPGLDPSLFASSPLLSTIDLTDAASVADFDLDESDDSDDDSAGNNKSKAKKAVRKALKQAAATKPTAKKPTGTSNPAPQPKPSEKPSDKPTEQQSPPPPPPPEPTCREERVWVPQSGNLLAGTFKPGRWETKTVCS